MQFLPSVNTATIELVLDGNGSAITPGKEADLVIPVWFEVFGGTTNNAWISDSSFSST